jgi:hypothetical protein
MKMLNIFWFSGFYSSQYISPRPRKAILSFHFDLLICHHDIDADRHLQAILMNIYLKKNIIFH